MRRIVALLLLLGVLYAADRAAASYATTLVADVIAEQPGVGVRPEVSLHGFPFLTQAISGRYDRVDVRLADVPAEELRVARLEARLTGARVPLSDVLGGRVTEVPVAGVEATAVLRYADLSAVRRGVTVAPGAGGRLRVTGTVEVLGQELSATAVSTVRVDGDVLTVSAERVELGNGSPVDDLVSDLVRDRLDLRVALPVLPLGLAITGLEVRADGVALRAAATDTVLRDPGNAVAPPAG